MNTLRAALLTASLAACLAGCDGNSPDSGGGKPGPITLRIGHFPNLTHAQALVAHHHSRKLEKGEGKGWFEERLGPDVKVEWFVYNAGPSAMEAIFAGAIDVTYVGPSPAINAYVKSAGDEIRIIAGSALGGSALVVQGDGRIQSPADFRGRKVATPQLGNTQDVACRAWLIGQGFKVTQLGGDVTVIPTANPDQLNLFSEKVIDAVWTVEPWVSQLENKAGGKVFLEEPDAVTTVLVSSVKFLKERRELAARFAAAHAELTEWIKANPAEAQEIIAAELLKETTRPIESKLLAQCWKRLVFTKDIQLEPLSKFVGAAQKVGFLRDASDLARLVEVPR